jgi:hypothetical protein
MNLVENRIDPTTEQIQSKIVAIVAVPYNMLQNWGPFLTKHFPVGNEPPTPSEPNV